MKDDKLNIGLGTVQFGTDYGISNTIGQTPVDEVQRILKTAQILNINLLDTAAAYGNAEEVLGMCSLGEFNIVSKFMPPGKNGKIKKQLKNSLNDLGVSSIYGYLAHRPMDLLNNSDQWGELNKYKQKNLVEKIGFSLNTPAELERLLNKNFIPDLIQVPYNYLDRRFEKWMILLSEKGCEIHTRSSFLQGLFFVDTNLLSNYFDEVKPVIVSLQKQARNLPGALLNFVIKKPFINRVIVGVENNKQLIQNVDALSLNEELPELKSKLSDNILNPSLWPVNQ